MKVFSARSIRNVALALGIFFIVWTEPWKLSAQAPTPAGLKYSQVSTNDMKEWLTYLASDQLQGRQVFTEGYGLAAQYIAGHLKDWGIKPLGAEGTYLQPIKLKGYRVTRNSSVTLEVNGQSRTFKQGDHVTFGANAGGKQTLTFNEVEFAGYGLATDYAVRDVKGKLVVIVPNTAPQAAGAAATGGAGVRGSAAGAIAAGARAAISFTPPPAAQTPAEEALVQAQAALAQANTAVTQAQQALRGRGQPGPNAAGGAGARGAPATADLTTVQTVDGIVAPQFTGDETFFEALFAGSPITFADVKGKAAKGEPLLPTSMAAKVTINIDNTYEVISEQIGHNVVGMIEGSDPSLKETYVLFGAHLDHIGYSQTGAGRTGAPDGCRRRSPAAQAAVIAAGKIVQRPNPAGGGGAAPAGGAAGGRGAAPAPPALPFDQRDIINNGADDDGSGSASLLAVAKAFATGPKPKRSIVFIWHTGEEAGLYGSRYNADFPVVPIEKIQTVLNMDMVGRDDCDDIEGDYTNTLFVVGADRISTDLHNLIVQTNNTLSKPLTLDYELNDAKDPEDVYTRSDHYSYAAKGIPIAFFTTGLHPDYHRVTDTVDKIIFPKMARVAQLVYETGLSIANTERILERDNKGPRTGFGSIPEILKK